MGSGNSREVSKQPGKSVVTQDTYIDEYDDNWFENQPSKTNKTYKTTSNGHTGIIHKTETNNNVEENQLKNGNVPKDQKESTSDNSKHVIVISSNKTANTVHRSKVVSPSTVMNMVDLEEYD